MDYVRLSTSRVFDVVILGAGIAGSMLGCVLARNGVSVLILDGTSHPRFAIGESTIPLSTLFVELLSHRFSVPELMSLSDPAEYQKHIGTSCGVKANFGYVFHREGSPQRATEAQQLGASKIYRHDEVHLFRQDTDAYLVHVANGYGAVVRQDVQIKNLEIDDDGVRVSSARGEQFRARYVVDATGFRSVLANKYQLRENPTTLVHQSRSLFTHMLGVKPYDEISDAYSYHGLESPWFEGTLHHLFDGGWIWVIPFNNLKGSTNPLCSVGLNLDPRRYPKTGRSPEEEFNEVLSRFPEIARQFEHARPAREWISTDRLQYSSRASVGDRWCLMSHASGFVDPFYSRGLINSMEVIGAFATRMLAAVKDGDFSRSRFEFVETLQNKMLQHNDELVDCSYIAFRDNELWNAYLRVWILGTYAAEATVISLLNGYRATGNPGFLRRFDNPPCPGLVFPFDPWYRDLFARASNAVRAVQRGELTSAQAAARIFEAIRTTEYPGSTWALESSRKLFTAIATPEHRDLFYRPERGDLPGADLPQIQL
ncbi:MAG: tryptophan 7-halogenase [Myxococcales bacterium]|nr:tryptophan 7-halogenase [Myxococcales bacterium]